MNPLLDAGIGLLGYPEQLDAITEIGSSLDVLDSDIADALEIDLVGGDPAAEGERRQDGQLVGGVIALDVETRIRFRIAEALRLLQAVFEGQPLLFHPRQDVVAGACQYPVDSCPLVSS